MTGEISIIKILLSEVKSTRQVVCTSAKAEDCKDEIQMSLIKGLAAPPAARNGPSSLFSALQTLAPVQGKFRGCH